MEILQRGIRLLFGPEPDSTQELEKLLQQVKAMGRHQQGGMKPNLLRRPSGAPNELPSPGAPKRQPHAGLAAVKMEPGDQKNMQRPAGGAVGGLGRPGGGVPMGGNPAGGLGLGGSTERFERSGSIKMEPGLGLPGAGVGGGSVAAAAAAGLGIRTNTPHNAAGAQKIPIAPRGSISGSLGGPNRATKPTPTPLDFRIPANTIKKEPQQQANTLPPARISRSDSLTKDLRKRKPSRPQVLSSEEEEESEEEKEEEEAAEEEEEEEREVVEEQEEELEEEGEQEEEGEDYQEEEDGDDGPKPYDACDICKEEHSEEGNAIVICDNEKCQKGFHQKCYVPEITQEVIDSQPKWYCRQCEAEKSARRQARAIKRKQGTETTDSDDEPLLPVAKRMKRDSESSGTDGRNGEDPRQKSKAQLDRELRAQRRLAQKDAYHREYKARKLAGEEARRSLTAQELNFPPVEEDTSVDIGNENDTA